MGDLRLLREGSVAVGWPPSPSESWSFCSIGLRKFDFVFLIREGVHPPLLELHVHLVLNVCLKGEVQRGRRL